MPRNRSKENGNRRDDWETPWELFNTVNNAFDGRIQLDTAASPGNAKCDKYLTDALNQAWESSLFPLGMTGMVRYWWWCNPPFNEIEAFLQKAWEEFTLHGNEGIFLAPSSQETQWFRNNITHRGLRTLVLPNRVSFISPETGKPTSGNTVGSVLVAFTNQLYLPTIKGERWRAVV